MKRKEKQTMLFSLLAGILLLIVGIIMAFKTDSQAMLMDALYDSVDTIIVILTIFLLKLYHEPISEKKPFGFLQLESFFILIKTFMILMLNISIVVNAVLLILDGGKIIDVKEISFFQFILFIGNLIPWLIIRNLNKKIDSPTLKVEILSWKSDTFYSLSLSIAFLAIHFLKGTFLNGIVPYFDQIVVIISSIIMIPDLYKVLKENISSVLLFAPSKEIVGEIKKIIEDNFKDSNIDIIYYDIIKTGRKIWVSSYFKIANEMIDIKELKEKTILCTKKLNDKIDNVYFELIPDVESYNIDV